MSEAPRYHALLEREAELWGSRHLAAAQRKKVLLASSERRSQMMWRLVSPGGVPGLDVWRVGLAFRRVEERLGSRRGL